MQPQTEAVNQGSAAPPGAHPEPITGWICEAGELPSQDPANNGRIPRAMLIQFDTIADCQAVTRGAPVQLKWVWDKPSVSSSVSERKS